MYSMYFPCKFEETKIGVDNEGIIFRAGHINLHIYPSNKQMVELADRINAYLQDKDLTKK